MWTKLAVTSVTSFYRAVVFALERRRLQLGWPMRMIDGRELMASIGTLNGFSETRERSSSVPSAEEDYKFSSCENESRSILIRA